MVTSSDGFGPLKPQPRNWADIEAITGGLKGIAIEEIDRASRIDWEYHMGPDDQRPCGRQGCERMHGHGFVLALAGNRYVNIGVCCGRKYAHAESWAQKEGAYKARRLSDAHAHALVDAAKRAQEAIYWVDTSAELPQAIALYESFEIQARGPFFDELESRARQGRLSIQRERRLTREEQEARREINEVIDGSGRMRTQHVAFVEMDHIAQIRGLGCIGDSRNPATLRTRLLQGISKNLPSTTQCG